MTRLTEHFTLEELTHSDIANKNGWDNSAPKEVLDNLFRLAKMLEEVRKIIGRPIKINSAYRSEAVNSAVGSKPSSQHLLGCAADIKVDGLEPDQVVKAIIASKIQYDQLIREFDSWTHISVPNHSADTPRGQTLIIDKKGTRAYS